MGRILVVDDEAVVRNTMKHLLEKAGHEVHTASCGRQALERVEEVVPDMLFLDVDMPGMNGMDVLRAVRERDSHTGVVILTGIGDVRDAVKAMKLGADDYILKPSSTEEIAAAVERVLRVRALQRELHRARERLGETSDLEAVLGSSEAMRRVASKIKMVAPTDIAVLIEGESGVGKEVVARTIHAHGSRADGPFVPVDCGAIAENLFESELFGHEKGAFTGAESARAGRIEEAAGGTLLLDEIGNLSANAQAKLLRVLQEKTYSRVGSDLRREADVRILAATNTDLVSASGDGRFRKDLYFRLAEFTLLVPPLRERPEDIPKLAEKFVLEANDTLGTSIRGISEEAARFLAEQPWPGNVRELRHAVRRATMHCTGDMLARTDCAEGTTAADSPEAPDSFSYKKMLLEGVPMWDIVSTVASDVERQLIEEALSAADGNKTEAAKMLSIDRKSLYNKLKTFGMP
mgnify:CR=1 FL=1